MALLTFAAFVLLVSIAQAAGPSAPLCGGAGAGYAAAGPAGITISAGRGEVFVGPTPVAASPATIIGGLAVSALVIALVAFVALGSRAGRRGELAPVTSLAESPTRNPAMDLEDRERKAA